MPAENDRAKFLRWEIPRLKKLGNVTPDITFWRWQPFRMTLKREHFLVIFVALKWQTACWLLDFKEEEDGPVGDVTDFSSLSLFPFPSQPDFTVSTSGHNSRRRLLQKANFPRWRSDLFLSSLSPQQRNDVFELLMWWHKRRWTQSLSTSLPLLSCLRYVRTTCGKMGEKLARQGYQMPFWNSNKTG